MNFFFINLYRHNTDQVSFGPLSSAFVGVMPLENLLGPVGDLYCFSNTFRMLVLGTIFHKIWIENPKNVQNDFSKLMISVTLSQ